MFKHTTKNDQNSSLNLTAKDFYIRLIKTSGLDIMKMLNKKNYLPIMKIHSYDIIENPVRRILIDLELRKFCRPN